MQRIDVYFLPSLIEPDQLAGGVSLVIDVLRATTTIAAALAAGAQAVIPCLEVDDARRAAANLPAGRTVLGGERAGVRIEGFDFGNSPREFTPATVGGKTLVFTTTNGTRAMLHARRAEAIWLAAFVNLSAVAAACASHERVDVICSGTGGKITREDVLLAGAIVARGTDQGAVELNDQALIAQAAWLEASGGPADRAALRGRLAKTLRQTQGGRNLVRLGLAADIDDAADLDRFDLVPRLDLDTGRISIWAGKE